MVRPYRSASKTFAADDLARSAHSIYSWARQMWTHDEVSGASRDIVGAKLQAATYERDVDVLRCDHPELRP